MKWTTVLPRRESEPGQRLSVMLEREGGSGEGKKAA